MDARSIIATLRDGSKPTRDELIWFANGLATGHISDAQAGAFAMAVCLNGLGEEGRVALTTGMRDSGDVLAWDLPGPVVDKHSTGGIGDCVSLILAPLLAACDVYVPMVSGRGLGHTGGTLDKLEAIAGLSTEVDETTFKQITRDIGCAIVSATGQIAPADKRLYAIRDVTATVESVDLITASILSKKLAAGLEYLVLDVKCGSGAFMKTVEEARTLASSLVKTATQSGTHTSALITDMSQPLAPAAGNALEVAVCLNVLSGKTDTAPRLWAITHALAKEALMLTGMDQSEAEQKIDTALTSGAAMERFGRMCAALGGSADITSDWQNILPIAPVQKPVTAPRSGVITAYQTEGLGLLVVDLGGGRHVQSDKIDPSVGISGLLPIGTSVDKGDPVAVIHAGDSDSATAAKEHLSTLIEIGDAVAHGPDILERIDP